MHLTTLRPTPPSQVNRLLQCASKIGEPGTPSDEEGTGKGDTKAASCAMKLASKASEDAAIRAAVVARLNDFEEEYDRDPQTVFLLLSATCGLSDCAPCQHTFIRALMSWEEGVDPTNDGEVEVPTLCCDAVTCDPAHPNLTPAVASACGSCSQESPWPCSLCQTRSLSC